MQYRYDVYFNLHKHCYSVIDRELCHVIRHEHQLVLLGVKPVVREAGRLRVLKTKSKNVHAFLRCEDIQYMPFTPPAFEPDNQATYNPYRDREFVWKSSGNRLGEQPVLYCRTIDRKPQVFVVRDKASLPELQFLPVPEFGQTLAAEWVLDSDIRSYVPPAGYHAAASLGEVNPITGEEYERSVWWIYLVPIGGEL